MRRASFLAVFCVLACAAAAQARSGAVFIHGKGGANLANA